MEHWPPAPHLGVGPKHQSLSAKPVYFGKREAFLKLKDLWDERRQSLICGIMALA
jgi:hypothetical protein